jgi:hypothetical protein
MRTDEQNMFVIVVPPLLILNPPEERLLIGLPIMFSTFFVL